MNNAESVELTTAVQVSAIHSSHRIAESNHVTIEKTPSKCSPGV